MAVDVKSYKILAFTRPKAGRKVGALNWTQVHKSIWEWRRSRIEGYEPRPQAHARLARAAVVPPASAYGSSRTRTAGHCAHQRASLVGTFSKSAILHRSEFLHIKGRNFTHVFIRSRLPVTPMIDEKFHGNRSARFWEIRKTFTQTDAATLYIQMQLRVLINNKTDEKYQYNSQIL